RPCRLLDKQQELMKPVDEIICKVGRSDGIPVSNHLNNCFIGGMSDAGEYWYWKQGDFPGKPVIVVTRQTHVAASTPDNRRYIKAIDYLFDSFQLRDNGSNR